jgi:cbb3-type cytochrome oxidase cytochrome c subunit
MKLRRGEWVVVAGSALIVLFAALTGSLIYLKPPPVVYAYEESPATQHGEAVYRREGCGSCHQVFGTGATYGPSLDGEGSRRTREWLQAYLLDPRPGVGVKPYRLKMPSYGNLKLEERDALVAYLQALRTPAAAEATANSGPLAQRAPR